MPARFVYDKTKSNFLRAESGYYLILSHSPLPVQRAFEKALFTKSFHGHYSPLGFLAEFLTAKFVGTRGGFWKWRQITAVALLATTLFVLVRNTGSALGVCRLKASLGGIGLTALLVYQPQMRDFVSWPFMSLHILWLIFTLLTLFCLVQSVRFPIQRWWPWLTVVAAYASINVVGLGLATIAAAVTVMAGMWLTARKLPSTGVSKLALPLACLSGLGIIHAILMLKLPPGEQGIQGTPWQFASFVEETLGFVANFTFATLRNLFSTGQPISPPWQNASDWPYGVLILLGFAALVSSALVRVVKEPTLRNQTRLIIQSFSSMCFLTIVALASFRLWHEPSLQGFRDYLNGPRYLVPSAFSLVGVMSEVLFIFASAPIFLNAFVNVSLVFCAISGNLQYAANVYPKVAPRSMYSHAHAWQSILAMARECRNRGLAIPNVPLGILTQEFVAWDLKRFEPLLRADLNIPQETTLQFIEWTGRIRDLPPEYSQDVPSLGEVQKKVGLKPE